MALAATSEVLIDIMHTKLLDDYDIIDLQIWY